MQQTTTLNVQTLLIGGNTLHATVKAMVKRAHLMAQLWVERRQLAALSPDQLADMGISPQDAIRESRRPFWDMPSGR